MNWRLDVALLVLVWRLAINPTASWWRDPPAILAAFWIAATLIEGRSFRLKAEATRLLMIAVMALLLGLFAWRQIPLTMGVLDLSK